jgi:hypothetical protein
MLKFKFLISIVFVSNHLFFLCQNLIQNPSFEEYTNCPNGGGQFNEVFYWQNPTQGSPDYFNSCNTLYVGVPLSIAGFQEAYFSGDAYVGLYTFSANGLSTPNLREYIQTQSLTDLSQCAVYELVFFVSLADNYKFAVNRIGAFIGDSTILRSDDYCFSYYEPQVSNPKSRMLDDKIGWTKIEGKFLAQGGENTITIGNFYLDSETDTLATSNYDPQRQYSYYYIDNVSLTLVSDESKTAFAGNDTILFPGDSTFIGEEIKGLNCTWRILDGTFLADSTSGIYVQPTETTTYVVEQNLCGTITFDTVTVFVNPVGLKEPLAEALEASGIVISPNPNNGSFEIQNPTKQVLTFELKNALGQVVYRDKIITEKHFVDINLAKGGALSLSKGIYFATFSNENGRFEEKIVVK